MLGDADAEAKKAIGAAEAEVLRAHGGPCPALIDRARAGTVAWRQRDGRKGTVASMSPLRVQSMWPSHRWQRRA